MLEGSPHREALVVCKLPIEIDHEGLSLPIEASEQPTCATEAHLRARRRVEWHGVQKHEGNDMLGEFVEARKHLRGHPSFQQTCCACQGGLLQHVPMHRPANARPPPERAQAFQGFWNGRRSAQLRVDVCDSVRCDSQLVLVEDGDAEDELGIPDIEVILCHARLNAKVCPQLFLNLQHQCRANLSGGLGIVGPTSRRLEFNDHAMKGARDAVSSRGCNWTVHVRIAERRRLWMNVLDCKRQRAQLAEVCPETLERHPQAPVLLAKVWHKSDGARNDVTACRDLLGVPSEQVPHDLCDYGRLLARLDLTLRRRF
mmetsp:Transcript_73613/g.204615  ORF Transcript_73613/g.204615 Transcript_73613/m.204615 type:complete len:314 (-) Transcript_73613:1838-2779(-)